MFSKRIVFTVKLFFLLCILVSGLETVTGKYGDTVEIPCNKGLVMEGLVKWKYVSLRFTYLFFCHKFAVCNFSGT